MVDAGGLQRRPRIDGTHMETNEESRLFNSLVSMCAPSEPPLRGAASNVCGF